MFANRLSREYEDEVDSFIEFALQNARDSSLMHCPCAKCVNLKKKNAIMIRAHLCCHGMDLTYSKWIWHGERISPTNMGNKNDEHQHQTDQDDDAED